MDGNADLLIDLNAYLMMISLGIFLASALLGLLLDLLYKLWSPIVYHDDNVVFAQDYPTTKDNFEDCLAYLEDAFYKQEYRPVVTFKQLAQNECFFRGRRVLSSEGAIRKAHQSWELMLYGRIRYYPEQNKIRVIGYSENLLSTLTLVGLSAVLYVFLIGFLARLLGGLSYLITATALLVTVAVMFVILMYGLKTPPKASLPYLALIGKEAHDFMN